MASPTLEKRPISNLRWWICGLLFFATTINYLDRQSLAVFKTTIQKDLGWSEADYGWITFSFQTAYAIFLAISGRIIDRIGVKLALGGALVLWSLMAGAHALVTTVAMFCVVRFLLGAAESFNFPASIKAVAQWHPQRERALSTGIFNSGSNVGIMLAAGVAYLVAVVTPTIDGTRLLPAPQLVAIEAPATPGPAPAADAPRLAGEEILTISSDDKQPVTVTLPAGATLNEIIKTINDTAKAGGVEVAAGNNNGKLRITTIRSGERITVASNRGADEVGQLGIGTATLEDTGMAHAWRIAFLVICVVGFFWLIFWIKLYNHPARHPNITEAERKLIQEDQPPVEEKMNIRWYELLRYRQVWPFLLGKFFTDPVWWFYLYWLPSYLETERKLSLSASALLIFIPYIAADIGSIGGGWISSHLIKRGWRVGPARYIAMLICALCMPGAIIAAYTNHLWLALTLISMAAAGHQGWSANIFTTGTDLFPSKVAGSVIGLGGTTGAIGGMLMTLMVGLTLSWLADSPNKYLPIFVWAGLMHPMSLLIIRWLAGPDMKQVNIDKPLDMSKTNSALLVCGFIVGGIGVIAAAMIRINWDFVLAATKGSTSAAWAGLTAMIGIGLIGFALIYAGLPKKDAHLTARS